MKNKNWPKVTAIVAAFILLYLLYLVFRNPSFLYMAETYFIKHRIGVIVTVLVIGGLIYFVVSRNGRQIEETQEASDPEVDFQNQLLLFDDLAATYNDADQTRFEAAKFTEKDRETFLSNLTQARKDVLTWKYLTTKSDELTALDGLTGGTKAADSLVQYIRENPRQMLVHADFLYKDLPHLVSLSKVVPQLTDAKETLTAIRQLSEKVVKENDAALTGLETTVKFDDAAVKALITKNAKLTAVKSADKPVKSKFWRNFTIIITAIVLIFIGVQVFRAVELNQKNQYLNQFRTNGQPKELAKNAKKKAFTFDDVMNLQLGIYNTGAGGASFDSLFKTYGKGLSLIDGKSNFDNGLVNRYMNYQPDPDDDSVSVALSFMGKDNQHLTLSGIDEKGLGKPSGLKTWTKADFDALSADEKKPDGTTFTDIRAKHGVPSSMTLTYYSYGHTMDCFYSEKTKDGSLKDILLTFGRGKADGQWHLTRKTNQGAF